MNKKTNQPIFNWPAIRYFFGAIALLALAIVGVFMLWLLHWLLGLTAGVVAAALGFNLLVNRGDEKGQEEGCMFIFYALLIVALVCAVLVGIGAVLKIGWNLF